MAVHIGELTKQRAASEIVAKLVVLEAWLKEGIPWKVLDSGEFLRDENGECQLDYYPQNLVEFGHWDGSQNTGPARQATLSFVRTNRSTVYRTHGCELIKIKQVIKLLKSKATSQIKATNKSFNIGELQEELAHLRKLSTTQANDITAAELENSRIQAELRKQSRELINLRQRYDDETHQLKQRVSELTVVLQKLTPLRKEQK